MGDCDPPGRWKAISLAKYARLLEEYRQGAIRLGDWYDVVIVADRVVPNDDLSRYPEIQSEIEETRRRRRFRDSQPWRTAKRSARERDGYKCQACGNPGRIVDHILPMVSGGESTDLNNLQTLCAKCHRAKTANEASRRLRDAYGASGPPLPAR
jgi:5-methylcytosine-specific restriction endonuclease McrA